MKPIHALLAASLILWAWRAAEFAVIGRFAPLALFAAGSALLTAGYLRIGLGWGLAVRLWGIVILGVGLVRTILSIVLLIGPEVSQHGVESLTPGYHAGTLFHLVAGFCLLRFRPDSRDSAARAES
jgi:hypothetical protein